MHNIARSPVINTWDHKKTFCRLYKAFLFHLNFFRPKTISKVGKRKERFCQAIVKSCCWLCWSMRAQFHYIGTLKLVVHTRCRKWLEQKKTRFLFCLKRLGWNWPYTKHFFPDLHNRLHQLSRRHILIKQELPYKGQEVLDTACGISDLCGL